MSVGDHSDFGVWDHRLRETESNLRSHVDVCDERYARIREDFDFFRRDLRDLKLDVQKGLDKINALLVKVGLLLAAGMAGILAKLLFFS